MPKKATAKSEQPTKKAMSPALLRRGWHTLDGLKDGAVQLRKIAAEIDTLVKDASDVGLKEIYVDGTTKLDRGFVLLRDFLRGVDMAVVKERHARK